MDFVTKITKRNVLNIVKLKEDLMTIVTNNVHLITCRTKNKDLVFYNSFKILLDGCKNSFFLNPGHAFEGVNLGYIVYNRIYILDIHHCRIFPCKGLVKYGW